jgi:hypothetical protein
MNEGATAVHPAPVEIRASVQHVKNNFNFTLIDAYSSSKQLRHGACPHDFGSELRQR